MATTFPSTRPSNRGQRRSARPGRRVPATPTCGGSTPSTAASVAIISASIGGGHNATADEISRRLRRNGYTVERYEFLDMFPARIGRIVSRLYACQLDRAPGTWGWLCAVLAARPVVALIAWCCAVLAGPAMVRAIGSAGSVVSTYPLANQVLGRLRRRGTLTVPAHTYLTDVSVHPLWIADGIDTYLAPHSVTAGQAAELGATDIRVVDAAVRPVFRRTTAVGTDRTAERLRRDLPATGRLALVAGGAWGVGDVEATARDIAATGTATPVVICATNSALRERLTAAGIGVALGWVDDMAGLMETCDMVVTNGGGITSVEAMTLGVPVLIYRALPGHGLTNAMAFDSAGLARWVRDDTELSDALRAPLRPAPPESTVDPAGIVAPSPRTVRAAYAGIAR